MGEQNDRGEAARAERARKLAAVMRENLKKRKAQERARQGGEPASPTEAAPPAETVVPSEAG
jgi:hypothetical protein